MASSVDRSRFEQIRAVLLEDRVSLAAVRNHVEHELAEKKRTREKLEQEEERRRGGGGGDDAATGDEETQDLALVVAAIQNKVKQSAAKGAAFVGDSSAEQVDRLRKWKPTTISDPSGTHAVIQQDLHRRGISRAARMYLVDHAPRWRGSLLTPRVVHEDETLVRERMRDERQHELSAAYAEMRKALVAITAQQVHQQEVQAQLAQRQAEREQQREQSREQLNRFQSQQALALQALQDKALRDQLLLQQQQQDQQRGGELGHFLPARAVISSVTTVPPLPLGWRRGGAKARKQGAEGPPPSPHLRSASPSSSSSSSSSSTRSRASPADGRQTAADAAKKANRQNRRQQKRADPDLEQQPRPRNLRPALTPPPQSALAPLASSNEHHHDQLARLERDLSPTRVGAPGAFATWRGSGVFPSRKELDKAEHEARLLELKEMRGNVAVWNPLVHGQSLPPPAAAAVGGAVGIGRRLRELRSLAAHEATLAMGGSQHERSELLAATAHLTAKVRRDMTVGALTMIHETSTYKTIQLEKDEKRRKRMLERRKEREQQQQDQQLTETHKKTPTPLGSMRRRPSASSVSAGESDAGQQPQQKQLTRRPSAAQLAAAFDKRGLLELPNQQQQQLVVAAQDNANPSKRTPVAVRRPPSSGATSAASASSNDGADDAVSPLSRGRSLAASPSSPGFQSSFALMSSASEHALFGSSASLIRDQRRSAAAQMPLAAKPGRPIPWRTTAAEFVDHLCGAIHAVCDADIEQEALKEAEAQQESGSPANEADNAAPAAAQPPCVATIERRRQTAAARHMAAECFGIVQYGLADFYNKQGQVVETFPWSDAARTEPVVLLLRDMLHTAYSGSHTLLLQAASDSNNGDAPSSSMPRRPPSGDLGTVLTRGTLTSAEPDAAAAAAAALAANSSFGRLVAESALAHRFAPGSKKLGPWVLRIRRALDRAVGALEVPEQDDRVEEQDAAAHKSVMAVLAGGSTGAPAPPHHHQQHTHAHASNVAGEAALRTTAGGVVILSKEEKKLLVRDVFGGRSSSPSSIALAAQQKRSRSNAENGESDATLGANDGGEEDASGDVVTKQQGLASMAAAQRLGVLEPVLKLLPPSFLFSKSADVIIKGFAGVDLAPAATQQAQQQQQQQQAEAEAKQKHATAGGASGAVPASEDENFRRYVEMTRGTEEERRTMQSEEHFGRGLVMRAQSTLDRIKLRHEAARGAARTKLFEKLEERRRAAEAVMSQRRGGGKALMGSISEEAERRAKIWKLLRMPPETLARTPPPTSAASSSAAAMATTGDAATQQQQHGSNLWEARLSELERSERNAQQCRLICIRAVLALLATAHPPSDAAVEMLTVFCGSVLKPLPELSASQFLRWIKRCAGILMPAAAEQTQPQPQPAGPVDPAAQHASLPWDCYFLLMWIRAELGVTARAHAAFCELHRKAGWRYDAEVLG